MQCPHRGTTTTYLSLTGQLAAGSLSPHLAEVSAYYSNRMSYAEVAKLLGRFTGQRLRSAMRIHPLVVTKAVEVRQQWREAVHETPCEAHALPRLVKIFARPKDA